MNAIRKFNEPADPYRQLFQRLPDAACLINSVTLNIIDVNEKFVESLSANYDSVGAHFPTVFLTDSGRTDFNHCLQKMKDESKLHSTSMETESLSYISKDASCTGSVVFYRWTISVVNESLLLVSGVEWKKTNKGGENSKLRTSELVEFFLDAPIGLHCVDENGIFLWANSTMLNMLGYTAEEYIGHHFGEFCPDGAMEEFGRQAIQRLEAGLPIKDLPFQLRAKNGDIIHLLADSNTCYNPDGSFNHSRCYLRNDHERIVREAVAREGLEKYRLMAAEKDRFIRCTFHQIRTPLHALATSFNTTLCGSNLVKGAEREVDELRSQLESCLGLVDDLALATMFDSDNVLQPRPVKMRLKREIERIFLQAAHNLGDSAVEEQEQQHLKAESSEDGSEKKRVRELFDLSFDNTAPRVAAADASLLRALHNLINNALKFRSAGSKVSVTVSYEAQPAVPKVSADDMFCQPGVVDTSEPLPTMGIFKFTVLNEVNTQMDLVQVHRAFQNYSAGFSVPEKDTTDNEDAEKDKEVSSPRSAKLRQMERQVSQRLTDSLVSLEGLGLGLYVAYNIVQSLGGLLECSASPTHSSFWFTLSLQVFTESTPSRAVSALSSLDCSDDKSAENVHSHAASPGSTEELLERESDGLWRINSFTQVEGSGEGNKHVRDVLQRDSQGTKSSSGSRDSLENSFASTMSLPPLTVTAALTAKPRVLIVDDSSICRKVLMKSLQAHGYDTDLACDGQEACDKLLFEPCLYHAVLMDLRMPIMDGITATRICKERRHLANVPIIIVTAELGEEVRAAAMSAKASYFISKPAKIDELTETLERLIHPHK